MMSGSSAMIVRLTAAMMPYVHLAIFLRYARA